MPRGMVTIVYSRALGRRRACYVPTSLGEDPGTPIIHPGEAVVYQPMDDYRTRGPDAAVRDAHGADPQSDRCVVVDKTNTVVAALHADPAVDALQNLALVLHPLADTGDVQSGATFLRTYAQVNSLGIVTATVQRDVTLGPPIAANVGGIVVASTGLKVGDTSPIQIIKRSAT